MRLEMAVGVVLKEFRTRGKFSQEKLALECGLDRTYISLLERGLRQPTLATIFKISKVLKITPTNYVAEVEKLVSED